MPISMTDEEMRARLIVLEVLCMGTLGLLFTLTGPSDPGHKKALTVLDGLKTAAESRLREASLGPDVTEEGEIYLDDLLSELSGNLGLMRPKRKGT